MQTTEQQTETFEPVWGGSAIARVLGTTDQQAFYILTRGLIPAKKIGGRWVADRNELIKFMKTPDARASNDKEDAA